MKISKIHLAYYSATYTTRKIVRAVASAWGVEAEEYDLTQSVPVAEWRIGTDELLIVGMPVFSGRIPPRMPEALKRFRSDGAPAVIICVYGNRDYDDALLELHDTVSASGFRVVSAGAFVAQHSVFPQVGAARPDEQDMAAVRDFAARTARLLSDAARADQFQKITVKGNRPYKTPHRVPLRPEASRACNKCGICVKLCPGQAIPAAQPRVTFGMKCTACGRCIVACPQQARRFGGLFYGIARRKFIKAYANVRREPETVFPPK